MRKILWIVVLWAVLAPLGAKADCTGLIDCMFGFTKRTEVRNERMVEEARINADKEAEIERLKLEQAQQEALADQEIERIKQQQFATEAARDEAIAREQARVAEYKASLQALVDEKVENIRAGADTQISALTNQALIAQAGITQTGMTERYRIAGWWAFVIVVVILLGALFMMRAAQDHRRLVLLEQQRLQLEQQRYMAQIQATGERLELVEVRNGTIKPY